MAAVTPVRMLEAPSPADSDTSHGAPADSRILEILASSDDLSSWSDELSARIDDWPSRFHLSPQRANFLRGLPLGEPTAVLEIGAGAGALTRYLGEIASVVDALELDPVLAAAARRRCADLPRVVVHSRGLHDVPLEPTYDLIVAAGVPASSDATDALAVLLTTCRALLRPGGHIVVAVDNSRGVRHLAGGTVPSLPSGLPPLLAARSDLEGAATAAGVDVQILGAFPDHRHTTRLIDHAALRAIDESLLERIVKLPSPAYDDDEEFDGALELESWTAAVSAGDDADHPNSFVLIAGESPLPVDPVTYWSSGRRAELSACNRVRATPEGPVVVREHAYPLAPSLGGCLTLRPHTEPYVPGTPLIDLLAATTTPDEAVPLLAMWLDLLDDAADAADDQRVPWDLIPRNVQVDSSGTAHAIDQEWEHESSDRTSTLRRGMFWLAYDLLFVTPTPAWLDGHTVASAADVLTALSGHEVPADWRSFLEAEAVSMASIAPRSAQDSTAAKTRKERRNLSYLSEQPPRSDDSDATRTVVEALSDTNQKLRARIEQLEIERKHDKIVERDHAIGLRAKLETALTELTRARSQLTKQRRRAKELEAELESIHSSTSWRLGASIVRPVARLTTRRGQ